jgi:hypothetical protein
MPKRWETVWEPLWMVAMPPFFSFPLGVWRWRLPLESGPSTTCKIIII